MFIEMNDMSYSEFIYETIHCRNIFFFYEYLNAHGLQPLMDLIDGPDHPVAEWDLFIIALEATIVLIKNRKMNNELQYIAQTMLDKLMHNKSIFL